jgi:hypothetical protein
LEVISILAFTKIHILWFPWDQRFLVHMRYLGFFQQNLYWLYPLRCNYELDLILYNIFENAVIIDELWNKAVLDNFNLVIHNSHSTSLRLSTSSKA